MTNKLKLEIDHLRVESFDTDGGGEGRRGTVQAASIQPVPVSNGAPGCIDTRYTGPCCEYTMYSCRLTHCDECM